MKDQWSFKVSLVLLPVDDFTGNIIKSPDIHISVPQAGRAIVKPDGFWIFPQLREPTVSVTLYGNHYQRQAVTIDVFPLSRKHPAEIIRILPSRACPFPPATVYMEGNIPEGATLYAAAGSAKNALRLSLDGQTGDQSVAIFRENKKNLDGKTYLLITSKTENGTYETDWVTFTSTTDSENGIFQIKTPLNHAHPKKTSVLYPAVTYPADTMGTAYFIALAADGTKKPIPLYCRLLTGRQSKESVFSVSTGETLQQNFMEDQ